MENLLLQFKEELKKNGLRVFAYEKETQNPKWLIFGNEKGVGNVQLNGHASGVSFTTCHYANTGCGTGFSLTDGESYFKHDEMTVEMAKKAMNTTTPHWYKGDAPRKYKNIDEYIEKSYLKYKEI